MCRISWNSAEIWDGEVRDLENAMAVCKCRHSRNISQVILN